MATLRAKECGCCGQQVTCDPDCDVVVNSNKKRGEARTAQSRQLAPSLIGSLKAIRTFKEMVHRDLVDLAAHKCSNIVIREPRLARLGLYLDRGRDKISSRRCPWLFRSRGGRAVFSV